MRLGVKTIVCGPQLPTDPALKKGLFVRPVLFTNISNSSRVAQEEIFGPVCCIIKVTLLLISNNIFSGTTLIRLLKRQMILSSDLLPQFGQII